MGIIRSLMEAEASGMGGGRYISNALQAVLIRLYDLAPGIPWYGMTLYGSLFLGMGLIWAVMVRRAVKIPLTLLLWPVVGTFFVHMIAFLNFTAPTLLLVAAGFLFLLDGAIGQDPSLNIGKGRCAAAIVSILTGILLRYAVAIRMLLLGLPLGLYLKGGSVRRLLPWIVVCLLALGAEHALRHHVNQEQPVTPEKLKYLTLRSRFQDSILGSDHGLLTDKALDAAGWTRGEYRLFRNWIPYDDELFTVERLELFLKANDPGKIGDFGAYWGRFKSSYSRNRGYVDLLLWSVALSLVLGWVGLSRLSGKERLKALAVIVFCAASVVFFMTVRFRPRVYVPLFIYILTLMTIVMHRAGSGGALKNKGQKSIVVLLVAVLSVGTLWQVVAVEHNAFKVLSHSKQQKQYIFGTIRYVLEARGNDAFLLRMEPAQGLGREYTHPLREWDEWPAVQTVPGTVHKGSGMGVSFLNEHHLSSGREFLRWTANNPRMLYVHMATGTEHGQVVRLMWESYLNRNIVEQGTVRFVPVYDFRNSQGWGMVYYELRSA